MQLCRGSNKLEHEEIGYSDDIACPLCEEIENFLELSDEIKEYKQEIEDLKEVIADLRYY